MKVPRHALLSLHDVTPFHLERLERAERLFEDLGVRRVAYLLVPDYHTGAPADTAAFRTWCRRDRPFEVDWILHGYYHLETDPAGDEAERATPGRQPGGLKRALTRRLATAGEGEFLALGASAADDRLARGMAVFERVLARPPAAFVPPAWLYSPALPEVLRQRGIRFWEDHGSVYDLAGARAVRAPVITWATRTPLRKWTSIAGTPVLGALWRRAPVLRLAVHPFDFDHEATVRSIRAVWGRALRARLQSTYEIVFASGAARA
jgi:uncharacterized protein